MLGLNKVQLIGHIGNVPEYNQLTSGKSVVKFSFAMTEKWKDKDGNNKEATEWIYIEAWGGLADVVHQHTHKGSPLYIEGRLKTESYNDKDGIKRKATKIIAQTINLLPTNSKTIESEFLEFLKSREDIQAIKADFARFKANLEAENAMNEIDELPF